MNVKLKVLTAGVLFFTGQALIAQEVNKDSTKVKEKNIEEVVILGYSKTSSKSKTATASTTITAETIGNRPTTSFLNSLQGSAPGVSINSQSGSPGSGRINVSIRGVASLSASTDPLYVIDGLISTGTEYRNLNQNDIETISVLRDAQATSIYGNYGANGVIVITTKGGRYNSGLRLSYDATTSFSVLPNHKYDLLSSKELLLVQRGIGRGLGSTMTLDAINSYDINTDWGKQFFRTAFSQNHNLGMRYGSDNISGYTSLGYFDAEGIVNNTDFKRFTFRTNINGRSSDRRLTYAAQIGLGYSRRHQLDTETNSNISNNTVQNPLLGMVTGAPFLAPYNGTGRDLYNEYGFSALREGRNIWILQDIVEGGIRKRYNQLSMSVNANVAYKLLDGLTISNKSGINYKNDSFISARTPNGYLSVAVAAQSQTEFGGWETFDNKYDALFNSVTSVNYDKRFGSHSISLGAYMDYMRGFYGHTQHTQNGLNPFNWSFGAGTGYPAFNSAEPTKYLPSIIVNKVKAGTLAYLGTLEYDYDSRYGISATVRRDGSYRFSDENKWETFWSVAGRWNIDRERFMEGSIFDMLKLRGSYGTNGNQNLGTSSINTNPIYLLPNLVYSNYTNELGYNGLAGYSTSLSNTELRWERIAQVNAGLDFGLFDRKIEGTVDIYKKTTKDMYLLTPISGVNGAYTIRGNYGEMRNSGIEASLRYTPFRNKDFKLSLFANFAYNENKIVSMPSEDLSSSLVNPIGKSAYHWNLYHYVGVNPQNGNYLFLDRNGNTTEAPTSADRQLTGKTAYSPYKGGFGLDVDYKGFYLTTLFSFQAGGWSNDSLDFWLHNTSFIGSGMNGAKEMLNAWTSTNTNTNVASLTTNNIALLPNSDRFLRRTDYIRLKNVSLGYNVDKALLRDLPIRALKIYVMGENLLTWTGWKGFDPETGDGGATLGVYPNARTFSAGLNIEF